MEQMYHYVCTLATGFSDSFQWQNVANHARCKASRELAGWPILLSE
jgi:hypothetical protein